MKNTVAIIGGGASGMMAAITAAQAGAAVTLFERNDRIGKKILVTGNGKCNLGNLNLHIGQYHSENPARVETCLAQFGVEDTILFFEENGLMLKDRDGYLYPACEQAAVVLDILRLALRRAGVHIKTSCRIDRIHVLKSGQFVPMGTGEDHKFDKVILACGGKAAPKTGSEGDGYRLAKELGHHILPVYPALVQLRCGDSYCKSIAGIRAEAAIRVCTLQGRELFRECGELQLTEYGISGIPTFQLSAAVNKALAKCEKLLAVVDFLPNRSEEVYHMFCQDRMERRSEGSVEEFFLGMLHKKLMMLFIKQAGLNPLSAVSEAPKEKLEKVFWLCRNFPFHITGSNGFEQAQVCAGGVDLREVTDDLESRLVPGLYMAGELLDVDGRCGGYNLQWAWTSGYIAGTAAAGGTKN